MQDKEQIRECMDGFDTPVIVVRKRPIVQEHTQPDSIVAVGTDVDAVFAELRRKYSERELSRARAVVRELQT